MVPRGHLLAMPSIASPVRAHRQSALSADFRTLGSHATDPSGRHRRGTPGDQNSGSAREGRHRGGCAPVFGMDVKALVWLGVPVDDVAAAVGFFAETLALDMVFEEADTVELSAANGDKIQLFGPGHRYFDLCGGHGAAMLPLFEVADVDQARAALAGGGVELLGAIESDAAWRWFLARGPDAAGTVRITAAPQHRT